MAFKQKSKKEGEELQMGNTNARQWYLSNSKGSKPKLEGSKKREKQNAAQSRSDTVKENRTALSLHSRKADLISHEALAFCFLLSFSVGLLVF
jgi:hypothetical protein